MVGLRRWAAGLDQAAGVFVIRQPALRRGPAALRAQPVLQKGKLAFGHLSDRVVMVEMRAAGHAVHQPTQVPVAFAPLAAAGLAGGDFDHRADAYRLVQQVGAIGKPGQARLACSDALRRQRRLLRLAQLHNGRQRADLRDAPGRDG